MSAAVIKLSAHESRQFWEIPIVYEDDHLLVLDKPAGLLTSPDATQLDRPSLLKLLHDDIRKQTAWVRLRPGLAYLMAANRLDGDVSGIVVLARSQELLGRLADLFGCAKTERRYVALVQGTPTQDQFTVEVRLGSDPRQPGLLRVDRKYGKRSQTAVQVRERFAGYAVVECRPQPGHPYQVQAHLRHAGLPVAGESRYGGRPLLLSRLKPAYRLKPGHTERPLISGAALHLEQLCFPHPTTAAPLRLEAPWPKHLRVALNYLRRFAPAQGPPTQGLALG